MADAARNRSLVSALRYRGGEGMWTWMLHRATGLGVLAFLIIHVLDTATVIYFPDFYDHALAIYQSPLFRFAEWLIFFSVLFHAANGLRIIIQDFWPIAMRRQRQLAWAAGAVVVVAMLPVSWMMLAPIFGWAEEPGTDRYRERMELRETAAVVAPPSPVAHSPEAAR